MRNRRSLFAFMLALGLLAPAFAQRPANNPQRPAPRQQPSPQPGEDEEVVRISTNLVQIDAVVTDKDGRHVTDLTPADFEIFEDGRRQEITNFSYVNVEPEAAAAARPVATPAARAGRSALPVPPARLRPGRARRTVVLVVDDLSMSAQTTVEVRRALKKYIDEQLDGDDLSAVIRTSSGSGVLQQFTSDKRLLGAAVERLRWFPRGRGGLGAVQGASELEVTGGDFEDQSVAGTLGALTSLVRGIRGVPGRKAVVLFTDSLPIRSGSAGLFNLERYRRLVDLANRSSVSFYAIDSRGLQPLGPTAADSFGGMPHDAAAKLSSQSQSFFEDQSGMDFLARGTGGLFFRNQNNVNKGLREVLDDQRGYYLLAYRPDDSTFDPRTGERKFRDLKVSVKRAGLRVRSRNGFFGVPEATNKERRPNVARRQLLDALSSPFGAADVDLRMAALFVNEPGRASAIRSIIHLSAQDLQFTEAAGGRRKAVLDVAAVVFTSDGRAAVQGRDQREVSLTDEEYRHALKNGLSYRLNVPVKQPGTYNLRVAVRDAATGRTGSAREFVHVPDLARGPLALSGVALSGVEPSRDAGASGAAQLTAGAGVAAEAFDSNLSPAVRRLRHGVFLDYGYVVYNARIDRATGQPRLTAQVRLFRDGQLVFTGGVAPVDASGQTDLKRLVAGGRLQVGTELAPGDYVLQVIVTDALAGGKQGDAKGTTTQWVDFEIVR